MPMIGSVFHRRRPMGRARAIGTRDNLASSSTRVTSKAKEMTAFSSMEYPHWLITAGVVLLMLGCAGLTLRQRAVYAGPATNASDQDPSETEADLNEVDAYNRMAKEKRRDRWANSLDDEETVDAKSKS